MILVDARGSEVLVDARGFEDMKAITSRILRHICKQVLLDS